MEQGTHSYVKELDSNAYEICFLGEGNEIVFTYLEGLEKKFYSQRWVPVTFRNMLHFLGNNSMHVSNLLRSTDLA